MAHHKLDLPKRIIDAWAYLGKWAPSIDDGEGIQESSEDEAVSLPTEPQSHRSDGDRADRLFHDFVEADQLLAAVVEEGAGKRALDELHGPGDGVVDVLDDWILGTVDGAPAGGGHRVHGRRVAVLRPAQFRGDVLAAPRVVELRGRGDDRQFVLRFAEGISVVYRQHRIASHSSSGQPHSQLPAAKVLRRESRIPASQPCDIPG